MRVRRGTSLVASVLGAPALVLLLAGCGPELDEPWATWDAPLETGGMPYAIGDEVHLPDGSMVDVAGTVREFVVAGDGIFHRSDRAILFTRPGERSIDTDLTWDSFTASPDGRYLAGIDFTSGPDTEMGRLAETVVIDLKEGREVVRSTAGMGDEGDDLQDLYEDQAIHIAGFIDDVVYVETSGEVAFDLGDDGKLVRTELSGDEAFGGDDRISPSGDWRIDTSRRHQHLIDEHGRPVDLDVARPWWMVGWLDDDVLVLEAGDVHSDRRLLTCDVAAATCGEVDGTRGEYVVFSSVSGLWRVDLAPRPLAD